MNCKDTQTLPRDKLDGSKRCQFSHEPNAETIAALKESDEDQEAGRLKTYTSSKEMFDDILNEDDD